jgi:putative salt-induced outer membrane protein YdiY
MNGKLKKTNTDLYDSTYKKRGHFIEPIYNSAIIVLLSLSLRYNSISRNVEISESTNSKEDRQHNEGKKENKKTNNNRQNPTQETKDSTTRTHVLRKDRQFLLHKIYMYGEKHDNSTDSYLTINCQFCVGLCNLFL